MNEQTENIALDAGSETVDAWAFVELFGHQKIAGRVTTRKLGTEVMFQVDVPAVPKDGAPNNGIAYSRLFSPKAIFSINPTTRGGR